MNETELETKSNAIEAVLSQHQIGERVTGGTVTPRSVIFTVVVKRTDAQPVKLLSLLSKITVNLPPYTATLGLCDDEAPLLVRLPSKDVRHVMVTGNDGAGKTSLLKTMCLSLAMTHRPSQLRLVLIGDNLGDLAGLPHTRGITPDGIMQRLGSGISMPRIVVAIDDLSNADDGVTRLLAEGCASGVHVLATCRPGTSSAGYGIVIEAKGEPGDFEVIAAGEAVRFTAAYITPAEIEQVVIGAMPKYEPTRLQQAAALV